MTQIIAAMTRLVIDASCRIADRRGNVGAKRSRQMKSAYLSKRFHESLAKAFAASAPQVRMAYFDLADFYRSKLGQGFNRNRQAN